jgi:subtilisin-like proprotein convertase family protein
MRKSLLATVMLGTWALSALGQNVYTENFDGCSLPSGWANTAVTGTNAWVFGAASPNDGGSIDGTCFAYIDDDVLGSGAAALQADLISPVIDLSAYGNAEFRFDYIFEDIGGSFMTVSFWNGTSWDIVWTENSDPGCFGFYPSCSPRQASISLAGYLNADFKAKITYNDNASWAWWASVDNIAIYLPPTDDAVLAGFASPATGCGLTSAENISLYVFNNGQNDITTFTGGYAIDGATWVTEIFTVNILPGDSGIVSFSTAADLGTEGTFDLEAYIAMTGDLDQNNDTASISITNIPVLGSSLPYFQDFESGDGGWTSGGANSSWAIGQPSGTFIDAAFSGVNAWVTNLAGTYNDGENSFIESPCMDFSSLVVPPVLRFKQIFTTEQCCDEGWVDISIDAGATWTRLGQTGEPNNWYNYAFDNYWNGTSGNATEWRTAIHLLDGAQGESSVKIRFFFSSDGSVVDEGFGIDDIEIFEQPSVNAGIVEVISPLTGCGLGQSDVSVVIENFGDADLTGFDIVYDAGNGAVTEVYTGTLLGGTTDTFTFATLLDLSIPATYTIQTWTVVANDGDTFNDSLSVSVTNSPVVAGLPYFEDFETGQGGWYSGIETGAFDSWQWGEPAGTFIDTANSGVNAWVTNLTGTYADLENSYVVSPCFDFSSLTLDPILSFAHIFNTESCCDEGWVDMSFDGGLTWQKVGAFGEGENWYTNEFGNYWNGDSDQPGVWRNASHILDSAAGESSVRIRFFFSSDGSLVYEGFGVDDVSITEQAAINGATIAITSPISGCGLTSTESVVVSVANVGSEVIDPVSISYQVNGGNVVTEEFTASLNSFDTLSFTFTEALDLSNAGDYNLTVWFNVANDGNTENDTLTLLVQSVPTITGIPYSQDFENGTGGWIGSGVNGAWELGQPQGILINSAFSGENAWSTNLNTPNYVDQQVSYLTSPCMDFSSLTDDPIIEFAIIYNSETNWDGTVLEVSTDGGTTWSILGNVGEGINWYTNTFDNWWDGNSGGDASWVIAEHILEGVAGEASVRVRYTFTTDFSGNLFEGFAVDDINIYPQPQYDLASVALNGPTDGCSLGTQQVTFTFWNKGLATLSNFPVGFSVNGGVVQTETVTASLAQGDSLTYTFNVEYADLNIGDNTIDVFTLLSNDEMTFNDSILGSVVVSYGNTPLDQASEGTSLVGSQEPEGTNSTLYFCGLPAGLNGGCFSIGSVTIGSLSHSWISDMSLYLISPAGDTVLLSQNNGGGGQSISNVIFDGNSTNDITLQTAGIAPGTYAPQDVNGFNTFYNGQDPNGGWTLYVQDSYIFGDDGVLNNWSMEFVDNSPVVELPYEDTTICLTHILDLTVPNTYDSYLWSTGQNTQTASLFGNLLGVGTHEVFVSVDYDGCSGISNSITVTVDACAGITELGALSIETYPNPTSGLIAIDVQGAADDLTVEVLDLSGKLLLTKIYGSVIDGLHSNIDISNLASGVYLMRFTSGDSAQTSRLIKN